MVGLIVGPLSFAGLWLIPQALGFAATIPEDLILLIAAIMPLTFSISNGLAIGFVSYPIIKLFCGKGRDVHWMVYLLSIIFIVGYLLL